MKYFTLLITYLLFCGCIMEDSIDIVRISDQSNQSDTLFDSYYWFDGGQVPLQKVSGYSFVIINKNKTDIINEKVTKSGINPKTLEFRNYAVAKKVFNTDDNSEFVWSKIPTSILKKINLKSYIPHLTTEQLKVMK